MATTRDLLRERVKDLADIKATVTTFDSDIEKYVDESVAELWPLAQDELAPVTAAITVDQREVTPSTGEAVALIEFDDGGGYQVINSYDWHFHNGIVYFDEPFDTAGTVRIFPLGRYVLHATLSANTTLPTELEGVIQYWALAKFYTSLAGNKRKYSTFVGASGSAASRDMKDSAAFFRQEGNDLLGERVAPEGA